MTEQTITEHVPEYLGAIIQHRVDEAIADAPSLGYSQNVGYNILWREMPAHACGWAYCVIPYPRDTNEETRCPVFGRTCPGGCAQKCEGARAIRGDDVL